MELPIKQWKIFWKFCQTMQENTKKKKAFSNAVI